MFQIQSPPPTFSALGGGSDRQRHEAQLMHLQSDRPSGVNRRALHRRKSGREDLNLRPPDPQSVKLLFLTQTSGFLYPFSPENCLEGGTDLGYNSERLMATHVSA